MVKHSISYLGSAHLLTTSDMPCHCHTRYVLTSSCLYLSLDTCFILNSTHTPPTPLRLREYVRHPAEAVPFQLT